MSAVITPRWLALLAITVAAMLFATSYSDIRLHLAIAALSALIFIVCGLSDSAALQKNGGSDHAIGASSAKHMGLVWLWGAAILGVSYMFLIPPWREWLHFFAGFAVVGILCMVFAAALQRDADAGTGDDTMLKLGRVLTIGQIVGMLATLIGIGIDPDKSIVSKARPDWAANIVFVFGGAALLALSAYAVWKQRTGSTSS